MGNFSGNLNGQKFQNNNIIGDVVRKSCWRQRSVQQRSSAVARDNLHADGATGQQRRYGTFVRQRCLMATTTLPSGLVSATSSRKSNNTSSGFITGNGVTSSGQPRRVAYVSAISSMATTTQASGAESSATIVIGNGNQASVRRPVMSSTGDNNQAQAGRSELRVRQWQPGLRRPISGNIIFGNNNQASGELVG